MTQIQMGFEGKTVRIPLESILPTKNLPKKITQSVKFDTILTSIRELGIIEPLAVHPEKVKQGQFHTYVLLDGHIRLEALKQLGCKHAVCLIAKEDEGYTYNRQTNRLSTIQEHKMFLEAIQKGVPPEKIAQVLNVNIKQIRERQNLLKGIAPEVAELLKNQQIGLRVFSVLRKMKPMRQIEAAEMMLSANRFTLSYAEMILATTREDQLIRPKKIKRSEATAEEITHMEREMEKLRNDYHTVEDTLSETILTLVIAKGYLNKLLRNTAIFDFLHRHYPELSNEIEQIIPTITVNASDQGERKIAF